MEYATIGWNDGEETPLRALQSEATVTFLDGILSTRTLAGLALNAYAGWWWADPLAGLLVGLAALNEAPDTWREARGIGRQARA